MERNLNNVFIAFGSNIGNRQKYLNIALNKILENNSFKLLKLSSIYETEPFGILGKENFYNSVILCETSFSPSVLLKFLQNIEDSLGRKRRLRWDERTIDLDILFYDDLVLSIPDLTIPHPMIEKRGFVLAPLNEISPDFIHPVSKMKIEEIFERWKESEFSNQGKIIKFFKWNY